LDDRLGVRLDDRDGKAQKYSEGETEKEVSAMFEGYNVGLTDREDDILPPKLELASEFRRPRLSPPHPLHTMDISSVRYRPVPVMAQTVLTSTYGHSKLELPGKGKVNTTIDGFRTHNLPIARLTRYPLGYQALNGWMDGWMEEV